MARRKKHIMLRERMRVATIWALRAIVYPAFLICVYVVGTIALPIAYNTYMYNQGTSHVVLLQGLTGQGTGFQVEAPSGIYYLVTNKHVCSGSSQNMLAFDVYSGRSLPRRILERFPNADLCILEGLPGRGGLELASSRADIGDTVITLGHSLGGRLNLAKGEVKGRVWTLGEESVDTNLVIYPGASGSPVLNVYGNVVGVIFAGDKRSWWGYYVPLKQLKDLLRPY